STLCLKSNWGRRFRASLVGRVLGFVATFLAVVVSWVFFRAPNFSAAGNMLRGMAGLQGAILPEGLSFALHGLQPLLSTIGVHFGSGSGSEMIRTWVWIGALLAIALAVPNSQEMLTKYRPVLEINNLERKPTPVQWALTPAWAVIAGAAIFLGVISINRVSEFLYWQF